jgi:pimeloyl-ACP methyl ester carboxylesterase
MLMPSASVNGINIGFDEYGSGEPVLLISGSGVSGRVWTAYQVPALTAAGYRVITMDNRGIPPSDACLEGFTIYDMAEDTARLIDFLQVKPCRIVGFSLGAMVVQELLVAHSDLATHAVLIATRGRADAMRTALSDAEAELAGSGVVLSPRNTAVMHAIQFLSPRTLNDEQRLKDWLDIFEISLSVSPVNHSQVGLELIGDRLESFRKISSRCLAIGFADDFITPPVLCREVADRIPDCIYKEVADCGHYGYLERPDEVDSLIIDFFRRP